MISPISDASTPAASSALLAATAARVEVVSPSPAMRRLRMPVRSTIHSSDVSTINASSELVISRSGRQLPVPTMTDRRSAINRILPLFHDICSARWMHMRSEEHKSELQSLMRNSYAVFCLTNKKTTITQEHQYSTTHNN